MGKAWKSWQNHKPFPFPGKGSNPKNKPDHSGWQQDTSKQAAKQPGKQFGKWQNVKKEGTLTTKK